MTVKMTVRAMNAATAILRPCDSLAAAMDGYSPERSGSDLLMQSAGLLIICHMREETTGKPANFSADGIVVDRFIGRIAAIDLIVRTVRVPVKSREQRSRSTATAARSGIRGNAPAAPRGSARSTDHFDACGP